MDVGRHELKRGNLCSPQATSPCWRWRSRLSASLFSSHPAAGRNESRRNAHATSPRPKKEKNEAELRRLLGADRKIEAIKCYREFYGVGLKEAKDAVELIENPKA